MRYCAFESGPRHLLIRPTHRTLTAAYALVAVGGGGATIYAVLMAVVPVLPAAMAWWVKALVVGAPLCFAAALVWWVADSRFAFRFDRDAGVLFDGPRPAVPLDAIRAVVVQPDEADSGEVFTIGLVLDGDARFRLHREWWPPVPDRPSARERAEAIAAFLGVEAREDAA